MKTITFYSYKGGAGRSLALANAARYLARLGFSVVALDFDLEAPGLQYKFSTSPKGEPLPAQLGVVDYLHRFLVEGELPSSLREFKVDVAVPGTDKPLIHLIPAGRVPSSEYWSKLSRINWHELLYSKDAQGVKVFLDLKSRIVDELNPDFLLIDSRTGITEMGGVATALLPDKVICLVLPSPENLEGARAVLRSLKRSRRDFRLEPLDVMVALSRLPEMEDQEGERELAETILNSLNEEAEDLQDTLNCAQVFVLHSEPALQVHEALRVGSGVSPDDSILLRDYLRLFANVVSKDLIVSQLGELITQARQKIWQDADGAMKDLEELTESFGHPEAYRALLQFYEIRNVGGVPALKRAQRLWELTYEAGDVQVWNAVERSFPAEPRWQRRWQPNPDFLESVWRQAGKREPAFGVKLADAYAEDRKLTRAADVLLETVENCSPSSALVAKCIDMLDSAGRPAEAESLVRRFRPQFSGDSDFLQAWASHALRQKSKESITELIQPGTLELLKRTRPSLAWRLFAALGREKEAEPLIDECLQEASERGDMGMIEEIGRFFAEHGRSEEFEARVRGRVPPGLLEDMRRPRRRLRL